MGGMKRNIFRTGLAAMLLALGAQVHADEVPYPTNQCLDRLEQEARLAPIAGKVALVSTQETAAAMLELDHEATLAERGALALWGKLRQACFDLGADFRREQVIPERALLAGRLFELHQRLLDELREGRMTYAEFNRRRLEVFLVASVLEAQLMRAADQAASPEEAAEPPAQSEI